MQNTKKVQGARIAFVAGSFKPPHGGDLQDVRRLLDSGGVDEVVIVISASAKQLPGSMQALDSKASELMWRAMLGSECRVRIEHAANSAAEVEQLPSSNHNECATRLRELLAIGKQGRKQFVSLLEDCLPRIVGERLWKIGQSELRDIRSVTADKLSGLHAEINIAPDAELMHANSTSNCLEFDTQAADGSSVRLKYIGAEVEGRHADGQPGAYPQHRLASAHHCLRWLKRQHGDADWFPGIHFFDASRRILAETATTAASHTLLSEFVAGKFDARTAAQLGEIVARMHATPVTEKPVRGSWQQEKSWWKQRRAYWYERLDIRRPESDADASDDSGSRCMVHLNLAAENVILRDGRVALRGFECASSIGDPVLDVLVVLANYATAGAATNQRNTAERAARMFARSYRKFAPDGAARVRRAMQLIQPCAPETVARKPVLALMGGQFITSPVAIAASPGQL